MSTSDEHLEQRVRAVISRTFGVVLEPGSNPSMGDPPEWDSLGHMNLVVGLESEFGVSIPTHAISELTSAAEIARCLRGLTSGANG